MPSNATYVIGGATQGDPGSKVFGTASNNTQTDAYLAYGYNNVIIENGGNLDLAQGIAPIGLHLGLTVTPYTTVKLGNAVGVTDTILLSGVQDRVLQTRGTSLVNSTVIVTETEVFGPGNEVVSLVNPGGTNRISLYETNNKVKLVGATNIVTTSGSSTINLNGNSYSSVDTTYAGESGASTIRFGGRDDGFFGYSEVARIATADTVVAGDENVIVTTSSFSGGSNTVTLGNGKNTVEIAGALNVITVGAGDNMIAAGSGNDTVHIRGMGAQDANGASSHDGGDSTVALSPNDNVVLSGGGNIVTATHENVTVTDTDSTGHSTVTLGNGVDTVRIGGAYDTILLGNGGDMVTGTQGMAFITTGSGNDTITLGGSGSTVNAGAGTNTIAGGTGSDIFVLPSVAKGLDLISNFTESNGDVLDLRSALAATAWNHQAGTLGNYLKVTDLGSSTLLAIAKEGRGPGVQVAQLGGVSYGLSDLQSHGSLLTA